MSRTMILAILLFGAACAAPSEETVQPPDAPPIWTEGIFEYVPPLQGQSIGVDGRFTFLYGPADGSSPMIGDAGTYEISGDTVTNTVVYSTDPERIGVVYLWTPDSMSGDTLTYLVLNDAGEVMDRGRSIKRH